MKLPIRIEYDGDLIEDAELREVSGADIAEVKRVGKDGDIYSAFLAFAVCCTKSLGDLEDKTRIREAYKLATFDTVYAVAIQGMALTRGIDKIEGKYVCKCGSIIDHTGEFADPLPEYESVDNEDVTIDINKVEICDKKSNEVVFSAENLLIRRPTVNDSIKAFRKFPDDESEMQFEVYKNCLKAVNGKEISEKERIAFGDLLFKKMKLADLNNLSNTLVQDFGKTECACMKCKRRWKAPLDLTNFFDLEAE